MTACRTNGSVAILAAVALLCGCHAASPAGPQSAASISDVAARILNGFDGPGGDQALSVGDEAMYRVDIIRGADVETTFLRVRLHDTDLKNVKLIRVNPQGVASESPTERIVQDPNTSTYDLKPMTWEFGISPAKRDGETAPPKKYTFESDSALAWIGLYGSDGSLQGSRFVLLPVRALCNGFYHPALFDMTARSKGTMTPEMEAVIYSAAVELQAALNTLTTIVISTPLLNPIVHEFIPFWVKLSALFRGISISMSISDITPFREAIHDIPTVFCSESSRTNFVLSSNESPIIRARLIGARPHSPLDAAAGLLDMEGESVADPTKKFRIRLLAARRAPVPTSSPTSASGR